MVVIVVVVLVACGVMDDKGRLFFTVWCCYMFSAVITTKSMQSQKK